MRLPELVQHNDAVISRLSPGAEDWSPILVMRLFDTGLLAVGDEIYLGEGTDGPLMRIEQIIPGPDGLFDRIICHPVDPPVGDQGA
jgi:hypothetical protein